MNKQQVLSVALLFSLFSANQSYVCAKPSVKEDGKSDTLKVETEKNKYGHHALKVSVCIDAPPSVVWEAIRENRLSDPDVQYSKFTQVNETERILEQRYTSLPVFGSTTCVLKLNEEVNKSIDYRLISSDRLSEFEGTWILSPGENERTTTLELSNHLKLNLPVPQRLIDAFSAPKMKARVMFVKNLAETKKQTQIAARD